MWPTPHDVLTPEDLDANISKTTTPKETKEQIDAALPKDDEIVKAIKEEDDEVEASIPTGPVNSDIPDTHSIDPDLVTPSVAKKKHWYDRFLGTKTV